MHNQAFEPVQSEQILQIEQKVREKNKIFIILLTLLFCLTIFLTYQNFQLRKAAAPPSPGTITDLLPTSSASPESQEPSVVAQELRTNTGMYPKAKDGYSKYYIWLPTIKNESDNQVEIVVGKNGIVDCNATSYGANLEEKNVEGWGYTYYEVNNIVGPMSTLMACGDRPKANAFIRVVGKNFLVRYNSKLPIVVYVPDGFEVKYKIWNTNSSLFKAEAQ